MKIPLTFAFLIIPYFSCFSEITGYWNFNGSLKATIGENLEWTWEQGDAAFGTTDTFAIPGIQGKSANVLEFPDSDESVIFQALKYTLEPNLMRITGFSTNTLSLSIFFTLKLPPPT